MITLGQIKIDNIKRMITLTDDTKKPKKPKKCNPQQEKVSFLSFVLTQYYIKQLQLNS